MRYLALLPLVLLTVLLPSAASGVPCPPLQCGGLSTPLPGNSLGMRPHGLSGLLRVYDLVTGQRVRELPPGVLASNGLRYFSLAGRSLASYSVQSGAVLSSTPVEAGWSVVGSSGDGRTAVLMKGSQTTTQFQLVGAQSRPITLDGHFEFDALSGSKLFLIQYARNGYLVRVYDVGAGRLEPNPLKDADEPALITGFPWTRLAAPDGKHLFTLYVNGDGGAMIHSLDLRSAKAVCIDLPGSNDFNVAGSYAFALRGPRLFAASGPHGAVVEVDVNTSKILRTTRFAPSRLTGPVMAANAAVTRSGSELAFSDGSRLWRFDLTTHSLIGKSNTVARGLGYGPSGGLWVVSAGVLKRSS